MVELEQMGGAGAGSDLRLVLTGHSLQKAVRP